VDFYTGHFGYPAHLALPKYGWVDLNDGVHQKQSERVINFLLIGNLTLEVPLNFMLRLWV
jgi:hypothetical protein